MGDLTMTHNPDRRIALLGLLQLPAPLLLAANPPRLRKLQALRCSRERRL